MKQFERNFGEWVVRKRVGIIVAIIIFLFICVSGARHLTFNNDLRVFFSEENPQLKALKALENTYNRINNVMFILAPEDGNVFTPTTLAAISEMTEASWKMPYSNRVGSVTNFQHTISEEDDLIVAPLVEEPLNLSPAQIERIKKIALNEPALVNRILSPTGHVAGVNVTVLLPGKSIEEVPEVAAFARNLREDIKKKYPGLDVYISGGVMFDAAFGETPKEDMTTLVPLMYLALIVVIGLSLRTVAGTFATLIVILMSMATGMGLAGWAGISITAASVNAPTIILTLAVADSIHILTTTLHQMHLGNSKHAAIAESIRVNLQPVLLTSVTTAIGFLTMNFSDAPPFRDLGNIVAMGVMAAFLYSVIFLPAFMAVIPLHAEVREEKDCCSLSWLSKIVIDNRKPLLWGSLLVVVFLASGTSRIHFGDDWVQYFSKKYDIRKSTDFMIENMAGFDIIEYSLESGETGGINDPKYLNKIEQFASWYRSQEGVVHVTVITDVMKRLNKNMNGNDDRFYRIPENRELAAQYLLLYEMSLPFGLDLNNLINVDKSATRMIVSLRNTPTPRLRELEKSARDWLTQNAPERMFTYGSGLSIIWAHISKRNIESMLGASLGALVLISLLLIFAFKSFKIGFLSLIPNLGPAFMAFGLWGFWVGQVGLGLSVIVSMTLGIVVDDSIHFISKYLRARREHNMKPSRSVEYAFNTVGTAMWVTTLALAVGFLILTFSGFKMNADMGLMTAITISLALVLDFLLLPALLVRAEIKAEDA